MSARFVVEYEDGGEWPDSRVVEAYDASHAATEAVEQWEREWVDYSVAGGNRTIQVRVRESGPDESEREWQHFEVGGEAVPQYYARATAERGGADGR